MIRRKKSSTGRSGRKRRGESTSPAREPDEVDAPPEFSEYDYEKMSPYILKALKGTVYPFMSNGYIHLIHELEKMLATNHFTLEYMAGEIQFMSEGYYPTPNLNNRKMPEYDTKEQGNHTSDDEGTEVASVRTAAVANDEEMAKEAEICLLPEEGEDDDFDEYPAYHVGTRFWTWCRKSFMGKIDTEFLENFKEHILDAYSDEELQKFLVNEPWKYRKRAVHTSRRKSLNTSNNKKKVSISNEVTSPSTSNGVKNGARKGSLAGYRIPNRRNSERDKEANNNKIMPIIDSMVYTACKEYKDGRSVPETPTIRRGRSRLTSPEFVRERKVAKMEIDSDSDAEVDTYNDKNQPGPSSRMLSPRQLKKEKIEDDDEYERMGNGNSSTNGINGTNGHTRKPHSPKRKNGDIRSYFNSVPKNAIPSTSNSRPLVEENGFGDLDIPSDIEDFDAKAIGSKIVAKLIAGGILQESSAQIFDQMTREDETETSNSSIKVEMCEEGKEDAEDQELGELAEELHNLQLSLKEEMVAKKALMMLTWRRAKAHFAFFHTFDQLKRGDYDLFKLGINMYRDFPNRKLPGISETMLLKIGLKKRNHLARLHYGKMYRRHPKFRWHQAYVTASSRLH
ncbi:hypothetical protein L5515_012007 [Caenorhabditis briggsae]|uniref:Uncharacterized protein n=1 Tax=Caenorhabditis briggsae TaxID=6238 RepID=A0AAE9JHS0_CAEBR|nr:hypothetical protein L3Y34_004910 [Caenorhabditis briggsae]UMM29859.1 hypothetical protein L5515_012007 [Caenorhabditis briggsae]